MKDQVARRGLSAAYVSSDSDCDMSRRIQGSISVLSICSLGISDSL